MRTVHFVMPDGIDDPARPSGGNTYDRNLCSGLTSTGWSVREHPVVGFWSTPDAAAFARLEDAIVAIPDQAVVLLDGLVASTAPQVLEPQGHRLRLVLLVHMPLGHRPPVESADEVRIREREALSTCAAVITTSNWSRRRLIELYDLPADRVGVAEPGVVPAELASGTDSGEALLCVAAVTADKGHDVLFESLAAVSDLPWHCTCVGSLDRDPGWAQTIRHRIADSGLAGRVRLAGTATGAELGRAYAGADVVLLPSRSETYGMVVTEALARGLPVIATDVGGMGEALGHTADGTRPGILVPTEDPTALAGAIRSWLGQPDLRARLRRAAHERRGSLSGWSTTTSRIAEVLTAVSR